MNHLKRWSPSGILLLGIGFVLFQVHAQLAENRCHSQYHFLNPLRRCAIPVKEKIEYETFRDQLIKNISQEKKLSNIDIALYFRDLDAGPWFGINEDTEFYPASLTKLPTMIALLKVADQKPEILDQKIGLNKLPNIPASVSQRDVEKTIIIGEAYPVHEVLRKSIVYSDNYADFLLRVYVEQLLGTPNFLVPTFHELGIANVEEKELKLTVKEYASIFRALYNSQFLSKQMSEKALELLAQTEYGAGLVAPLPPNLSVAHKFGFFEGGKKYGSILQLHDCGIIYHPKSPYTLCIMTRGKDIKLMTSVIAELSKVVYDEVTLRAGDQR